MKKIISVLLIIALSMASLTACGSKRLEEAYENAKKSTDEELVKLGLGENHYDSLCTLDKDNKTITVLLKMDAGSYATKDVTAAIGAVSLKAFEVSVKNIAKELEIPDNMINSILKKCKEKDSYGSETNNGIEISYEGLSYDKTNNEIKKSMIFKEVE